jgi:hypothetical protein
MYYDLMIDNNGQLETSETFLTKQKALHRMVELVALGKVKNKAILIDKRQNLDDLGTNVFYHEFYKA